MHTVKWIVTELQNYRDYDKNSEDYNSGLLQNQWI